MPTSATITSTSEFTVLHVEDDPDLGRLVRFCFEDFGFHGRLISTRSVAETLTLLHQKEHEQEFIQLVLVDIELPDGSGMDVIRALKSSPWWRLSPVIVLSGSCDPEIVNSAYALGANCFLTKCPRTRSVFDSLEALYRCWLETAVWPQMPTIDRLQGVIVRAVQLRARTADFYLTGARGLDGSPDMGFWLDLALNEGNLSNLLAFIQPLVHERDAPGDLLERFAAMQARVEFALQHAESHVRSSGALQPSELCSAAMKMTSAFDESCVAQLLARIFTLNPRAVTAFKTHAAAQLNQLAQYTLNEIQDAELRERAKHLQTLACRMLEA